MGRKRCTTPWPLLAVLGGALSLLSAPVWAQGAESATRNYEDDLNDVLKVAVEKLLPLVMDIVTRPEVSTDCSTSMLKTFVALRQQKAWAIRMAMSNAMYAPNALEGTYVAMGGYDQCLRTRVRSSDGELYFKGQYCSVVFSLPAGYYRRFIESFHEVGELQGRLDPLTASSPDREGVDTLGGLCAPSMCTRQDLTFLVRSLINEYGGNATVTSCSTDDAKVVNSVQAFSIAVLCLLGVLVGVGTTLEWLPQADLHALRIKRGGTVRRVLLVFSAITNTKILLRTTVKTQNEALKFICGLKVIMTFWVVLGHAYIILPMGYFHAVFAMDSMTENFTFQFITNAFLSVTIFFFLSGFLLAYVAVASREVLARTNPFLLYIVRTSQRYIRLVVPAMATILVAFLLPLFAYGPAANDAYSQYIHGCYSKWWIVLLQANNFDNSEHVCLQHMWYISAELQIFLVVAFPLALLFIKHPRAAAIIGALTAAAFCLMTCVQIYSWDLFYAFTSGSNDMRRVKDTLELIYFRPFTHAGSYIIGVMCGYVAAQYKNVTIKPNVEMGLWLVSLALACGVLFASFPWNQGHLPDAITNALYGGFHRLLWSLAFFWPSYACATGRGGVLNNMLSWSFFLPLSRLTYGIYLIHVPLYITRMLRLRSYINTDEFFQLTTALGVFLLSVVFAYLLHVCIEAPTVRLQKLLCEGDTGDTVAATPVNGKPRNLNVGAIQKSAV
ncbi:nose resistant to fluoxetine protein 6-like [Rhipicephalus sanguineus]|uniref:nose resistant to fluoxetine protein 6-like n=1 Tax=Rhipicephalus sanguineus TaxID=34632 RepID=UPI001895C309|nr:nose resistant to fluoxetine protein 6-like [Rhipicephalus sanguineus]